LKVWQLIYDTNDSDISDGGGHSMRKNVPSNLHCIYTMNVFSGNISITSVEVYIPFLFSVSSAAGASSSSRKEETVNNNLVLIGSAEGDMHVYRFQVSSSSSSSAAASSTDTHAIDNNTNTGHNVTCQLLYQVDALHTHTAGITRMKWRQQSVKDTKDHRYQWASCSEDHTVRIHQLSF
jgi:hypothetical protein